MLGDNGGDSGSCTGDSSPEKIKSTIYNRKRNKPLMEKRRRARINDALVQLKALVLESMQHDTTQYSKLEKADILEMTVSHVARLQKLQILDGARPNLSPISKYRVGFNECANEVIRYLGEYRDGTCSELRTRLLNHLAGCIETSNFMRRGTLGQCGKDGPNNVNNCVNTQDDGHLRDITFRKQTPDTLVNVNDTTPLQRDSTKRQLSFHGNQLRAQSSTETMYNRLQMPATSQPEQNQYSALMNRNQRVERQKNIDLAHGANSTERGRRNVNETNIENVISEAEFRQNQLGGARNKQQEGGTRRGSLLNRHVNQMPARETYINGPLPLFARGEKTNIKGAFNCDTELPDCFNRHDKIIANPLYSNVNPKDRQTNKQSTCHGGSDRHDAHALTELTSRDSSQVGFNSDVWRPW